MTDAPIVTKTRKPRAPKATAGTMLGRQANLLPLSEYPAMIAAMPPIVQQQFKALLAKVQP